MKRLAILITTLIISVVMFAQQAPPRGVPATPHPIEVVQPNGEKFTFRLFGDEWSSYKTTTDGYLIQENKKGVYCYARIDKKGDVVATRHQARNPETRGNRAKCLLMRMAKNSKLKRF